MTKVLITQSKLDDLAETIGAKTGQNIPLTIDQMKNAIYSITIPRGTKSITENGAGIDIAQYANIDVNVQPTLQFKSITPTTSQQTVSSDSGYDGLSSVTVGAIPSEYIVPSGTKSITENGTGIDVVQYSNVDVAVEDSTIVVTLSYNESTEMWEPNKTFAEIQAAHEAGKTIAVEVANGYVSWEQHTEVARYEFVDAEALFAYTILKYSAQTFVSNWATPIIEQSVYILNANGLSISERKTYMVPNAPKTFTSNGEYDVAPLKTVTVNVPTPEPTLQSKSVSYTPSETAQSATVTADSGYDGLSSVDVSVGAISSTYIGSGIERHNNEDVSTDGPIVSFPAGYYAEQHDGEIDAGEVSNPSLSIKSIGHGEHKVESTVDVTAGYVGNDTKTNSLNLTDYLQTKTVTPTESQQLVSADDGKIGLYGVTVEAVPSDYVGSGITRRSSTDLAASGGKVTVPEGYYSTTQIKAIGSGSLATPIITIDAETGKVSATAKVNASGYISSDSTSSGSKQLDTQEDTTITPTTSPQIAVTAGKYTTGTVVVAAMPSGTEGTPVIEKDTPSHGEIVVRASVTNTAGYIEGGTHSADEVMVDASELVNGTYTITGAGTHNVTYYENASIAAGGATASATKGSVNNHSITVTPSVTRTAGYITAGTANGTAVTISASELVSGTYTVNSSGTKDITNYASISVPSGNATAPASITGTAASLSAGINTLTLTKSVSVTPSVTAGYVSSGTAGNSSVSLTANVTTKAAATITPSTTNQTIAAGTYLTGTQTIAGDADLIADNIISTANIFGVQGSVVVQNYYTGSSEPSSSLGQNGDIYLQG